MSGSLARKVAEVLEGPSWGEKSSFHTAGLDCWDCWETRQERLPPLALCGLREAGGAPPPPRASSGPGTRPCRACVEAAPAFGQPSCQRGNCCAHSRHRHGKKPPWNYNPRCIFLQFSYFIRNPFYSSFRTNKIISLYSENCNPFPPLERPPLSALLGRPGQEARTAERGHKRRT